MLSDKDKKLLLKKMHKVMRKDKLSLREIIDTIREYADYLESLLSLF